MFYVVKLFMLSSVPVGRGNNPYFQITVYYVCVLGFVYPRTYINSGFRSVVYPNSTRCPWQLTSLNGCVVVWMILLG